MQESAFKKIELFRNRKNHKRLEVHKLHGKYVGFFGFSIDRKNRIMFEWISDDEVRLHTVGDHDIYNWMRNVGEYSRHYFNRLKQKPKGLQN